MSDTPAFLTGTEILMAENAALQLELARLKESADYAWRNTRIVEAARQKSEAQLTETQKLLEVQLAVGDKLEAEVKRLASKVLHYENTVCMPDMRRMLVSGAVAAEVCPKKVGDLLAQLAALRETYERDTQALKARIRTLDEYFNKGNVWRWESDGENHLESLTCPILISAEDLRDALGR